MGKAATLNGRRGDVMIPNVTYDEHSDNTYLYDNCFAADDVGKDLVYGTVLDNQKSVAVLGTYLQNAKVMEVIYREGYTDIEMEAGPYLSAVYELTRPKRHPIDEIVTLYNLPFDLGILHYASDTPLTKGENLGAGTLSILRRRFHLRYLPGDPPPDHAVGIRTGGELVKHNFRISYRGVACNASTLFRSDCCERLRAPVCTMGDELSDMIH